MKAILRYKGGEGSGNFAHQGRPGEVGGSDGNGGNISSGYINPLASQHTFTKIVGTSSVMVREPSKENPLLDHYDVSYARNGMEYVRNERGFAKTREEAFRRSEEFLKADPKDALKYITIQESLSDIRGDLDLRGSGEKLQDAVKSMIEGYKSVIQSNQHMADFYKKKPKLRNDYMRTVKRSQARMDELENWLTNQKVNII